MNGWTIGGLLGIIGLIAGIYRILNKHTSDSNKHPESDKVMYKDTCEERSKRIEDCAEEQLKALNGKVDEHHKYNKTQFAEIKTLIKEGKE